MRAAGIVNFGTELVTSSFAAVAQAMGVFGRRVEAPGDLERALVDAFNHDGPAVVDVVTAPPEAIDTAGDHRRAGQGLSLTPSGPFWPGVPTNYSTW